MKHSEAVVGVELVQLKYSSIRQEEEHPSSVSLLLSSHSSSSIMTPSPHLGMQALLPSNSYKSKQRVQLSAAFKQVLQLAEQL